MAYLGSHLLSFFFKNTTLYSIQLFPEKAITCFIIIRCAGDSHACPLGNCWVVYMRHPLLWIHFMWSHQSPWPFLDAYVASSLTFWLSLPLQVKGVNYKGLVWAMSYSYTSKREQRHSQSWDPKAKLAGLHCYTLQRWMSRIKNLSHQEEHKILPVSLASVGQGWGVKPFRKIVIKELFGGLSCWSTPSSLPWAPSIASEDAACLNHPYEHSKVAHTQRRTHRDT